MNRIDVWFCRFEGDLYYVSAWHCKEPKNEARAAESVKAVLDRLKRRFEIVQVGILPPEMIGLDIEV